MIASGLIQRSSIPLLPYKMTENCTSFCPLKYQPYTLTVAFLKDKCKNKEESNRYPTWLLQRLNNFENTTTIPQPGIMEKQMIIQGKKNIRELIFFSNTSPFLPCFHVLREANSAILSASMTSAVTCTLTHIILFSIDAFS